MKLFVLLSRVPYPLEKGDKLRAYHLVKHLAERHEVFLCCLSDQRIDPAHLEHLRGFCHHLEVVRLARWRILLKLVLATFGRLPYQVAYFHHRRAQERIDDALDRFARTTSSASSYGPRNMSGIGTPFRSPLTSWIH